MIREEGPERKILTGDICLCHIWNNNDPNNTDYNYAVSKSGAKLVSRGSRHSQARKCEDRCQKNLLSKRDPETPKKRDWLSKLAILTWKGTRIQERTNRNIITFSKTFAMPLPMKKAWKLTQEP